MSTIPPAPENPKAAAKAAKAYAKATRPWYKKKRFALLALILVAIIASVLVNGSSNKSTSSPTSAAPATSAAAPSASAKTATGTATASPTASATGPVATASTDNQDSTKSSLTGQQQMAVEAAKNYLSLQGFSRLGLIQQLSSSAGDGYSKKDATVAVDSLNVDWNAEAVKSAENYLSMQSFSCSGLIEQLSSSAGDQFTAAQASYGAHHTKACS